MTDNPPVSNLAERAIARLKKLAAGNGLEPSDISIFDVQEQVLTLKAVMKVSPLCDVQTVSYSGRLRDKNRRIVNSPFALQDAVARHKESFRSDDSWVAASVRELEAHDTGGWGLESAKITLPDKSAVFALTQTCQTCNGQKTLTCDQCQGQGTVVCTQCQGRGREPCYHCLGSGEDPQLPGFRCHVCGGSRLAPCRFCQSTGYLPCPTCNGTRGVPCGACQGAGCLTQEVTVTCGAETHFSIIYDDMPAGFRRGVGRIGIENLPKGHADITAAPPPETEDEDEQERGPLKTALLYEAVMPYAEMKMDFGGKKAFVSAVGKRCAITGVPFFLDRSLGPWREKLGAAAHGRGPLEDAVKARAIGEILGLLVAGKGYEREIRRIYPFGLSPEVIREMLADTKEALKKTTLKTRAAIATGAVALSAVFFYFYYVLGHGLGWVGKSGVWASLSMDIGVLAGALLIGWIILNFSTRFSLQRRFPQIPFAMAQRIGKICAAMLAGIGGCFIGALYMAPVKPLWIVAIDYLLFR